MKKNFKELYQSAVFITDTSLDGKISLIERSLEHQATPDKLLDAYQ